MGLCTGIKVKIKKRKGCESRSSTLTDETQFFKFDLHPNGSASQINIKTRKGPLVHHLEYPDNQVLQMIETKTI